MNIFKKIGAALLAAALMTATTLTANAEEDAGFTVRTAATDGGISIEVTDLSPKYEDCDVVWAQISFASLKIENGSYKVDHTGNYGIFASSMPMDQATGLWYTVDANTGNSLPDQDNGTGLTRYLKDEATGRGSLIINITESYFSYKECFSDCNAYMITVFGVKNEQQVVYSKNGVSASAPYRVISVFGDLNDSTSSEPTSSDTSSEPASSDTSSEPTSSDTSSEPPSSDTSSEPTSSASVSSENSGSTSGGNDNPNSGAVMLLIPLAIIGGAAVMASAKKRK